MKKRYHVTIHGRVQGVMFRHNTAKMAEKAGITGWVRNNADGSVEAVFEGDEDNLIKALNWCRKGTLGSRVERVDVEEEGYKGEFEAFYITN